jgi:hypothetical protein
MIEAVGEGEIIEEEVIEEVEEVTKCALPFQLGRSRTSQMTRVSSR